LENNRACKECQEEACQWNQYRIDCGHGSATPGTCVYDCDDEHNCFVGHSDTNWFDSEMQWSDHAYPSWPNHVRVRKVVRLNQRARGTSKGITVGINGKISIRAHGGNLEIGPKSCDASEYQAAAHDEDAGTNRQCEEHDVCTEGQYESAPAEPLSGRECTECGSCADGLERMHCSPTGTTSGYCLPSQCAAEGTTCWVGEGGAADAGDSWSMGNAPTAADNVVITGQPDIDVPLASLTVQSLQVLDGFVSLQAGAVVVVAGM
jgi:hypothetical protein